ncbi:MAG: pyruvate:ferredoxin (flavodoxin) oxidoreductase [Oscillospiraceae bacterium]|nr:pyruvate:ferredoxin (flavodoxin) oxidoreductase [Oscillospiraceae bacterium]
MSKAVKAVMDGNTAASHVSYAFTEVAGIYPITPSSQMAEYVDAWSVAGRKNIFGNTVKLVEMQSEAGAAGVVHGSLAAGALTTTFTASQGLLLKIPNMYKISGELLPGVIHVSARALSVHGLSIFGDHSDVLACRQTGFAMLASGSPQEVMDLGAVAHLSAIRGRVPFLHFFDGFRTSHELQKIDVLNYDDLGKLVDMDAVHAFRARALNPEHPTIRGTTQNPDIYFQGREACNLFYDAVPGIVADYMKEINKLTGRDYQPFNYYGHPEAEHVVVAMGSSTQTICETVDHLVKEGKKVGVVVVRLYRPFAADYFLKVLPKTVKRIAALDRTKEPGALGEPMFQDICTVFYGKENAPLIIGGRYGLASKEMSPAHVLAIYDHLMSENPRNNFTVGINDDVTHLSLTIPTLDFSTEKSISCKIWGMGSDGTVGANKNTVSIVGDETDMYTQAYFVYDSKKSGGVTQSHLRFSNEPIRSTYLVNRAGFIACHQATYLNLYNILKDLAPGGTFLLNCKWNQEEMEAHLPAHVKKALAEKKAKFYAIDAVEIARDLGLGGRINTVLQAAFFKLADIIPLDTALAGMRTAIKETYFKRGEEVIQMNLDSIDRGISGLWEVTVPESWATIEVASPAANNRPEFIKNIVDRMNRLEGNEIPVSGFNDIEDGTFPCGTSAYEKRGVAVEVPCWHKDNCVQCNLCAMVCPHAVLRPYLLTEAQLATAPAGFETKKAIGKGLEQYSYRLQVSPMDCTGCEVCVNVCPTKNKNVSLEMRPLETQLDQRENWDFGVALPEFKLGKKPENVKESQFAKPLFEFSGACAGCGETPYIKLATQLFGDSMYVANASGCSSAYGGSTPSVPYSKNERGHGPAWAMSLFEDNAEYAYGMLLGAEKVKQSLKEKVAEMAALGMATKEAAEWLEHAGANTDSRVYSENLLAAVEAFAPTTEEQKELKAYVQQNKDYLPPKSYWAFGGDGWAYDIGFGGLDHVIASGDNINMLIMDTEVYSNTGGQASKATSTGAIAKFAGAGKRVKKKDLGMMAMSYGYVYVAQIAVGADPAQTLKAFQEAESYPGPSIIIAYSPCIEHGMKCGMAGSLDHTKKAVEAGYWHLYRFDPRRKEQGLNPFILDSKEPTADFQSFLMEETRYASMTWSFPEQAKVLLDHAEQNAKERLESYQRMARD